jgi:BMFP domain-containing protein YqiC
MLDVKSRDELADLRERIATLEAKVEIIEKRTT